MLFIETSVFTRLVVGLLKDEGYRALQAALQLDPEQGPIIPGTGGLRKIRWLTAGTGKRGGLRVIYYWYEPEETVLLLYLYRKSRQTDLTADEIEALAKVVRKEYP